MNACKIVFQIVPAHKYSINVRYCCYSTVWKRKWMKYIFLIEKCQWVFWGENVDGVEWTACVVLLEVEAVKTDGCSVLQDLA